MDTKGIIRQAEGLRTRIRAYAREDHDGSHGEAAKAQVCEFLRAYAGPKSFSPERRAQLDVVSDILGQANLLLEDDRYHPAAAAILIGASLEEFLRTWVDAEGLRSAAPSQVLAPTAKLCERRISSLLRMSRTSLPRGASAITRRTVSGARSQIVLAFASCSRVSICS
jgi:hypothetical protein